MGNFLWLWIIFFCLMKIISWNVNSVRARIENIKNYIKDSSPDVLLLQEIKTPNENFPSTEFENLGYISHVLGKKVKTDFIKDELKQSRIITGELSINLKKNRINKY